jgi:hypothetical protein
VSINKRTDKLWYIHSIDYYSAINRNKLLKYATFCTIPRSSAPFFAVWDVGAMKRSSSRHVKSHMERVEETPDS